LGGGREDTLLPSREGAHVQHEHLDPELSAVRVFVDAVLALSDDPLPENVERYLAASDALEGFRLETKAAHEPRGLTKGRI
jgi:hypothetical protein